MIDVKESIPAEYAGYPKLINAIFSRQNWFKDNVELFSYAQAEIAQLLGDSSKLEQLVQGVDLALTQALDPRYRFVIQNHYGLNPFLGEVKNDREIGDIAPRVDGGIGLSRNLIRVMRIRSHYTLFKYQREHPIAGLSYNP